MLPIGPVKVHCGFFYHHGLHDGNGFVFHNSKKHGMIVRESVSAFSEGKTVVCSDISSNNPSLAIEKAASLLGKPYDLFSANCEHFVQFCNENKIESPQIQKYFIGLAGIALAMNSKSQKMTFSGIALALTALLTPPDQSPIKNASAILAASVGIGMISN